MIIGLGIDLVDIPRFKEVCKDTRFIQKYFAKGEWDLSVQSLAGRFAARESLFKALRKQEIFSWGDIEVVSNKDGSPSFKFYGQLDEFAQMHKIHLSISHSEYFATAIVIIESF
jgi:holo-[acyl-carrier protein] synthase